MEGLIALTVIIIWFGFIIFTVEYTIYKANQSVYKRWEKKYGPRPKK